MGLKERLLRKKKQLEKQYQHGKKVTEQMKAERMRHKINNLRNMEPGVKRTIVEGLQLRKSPLDVMHEEYYRRKELRRQKYGKK